MALSALWETVASVSKYTQEQAGGQVKAWAQTRERLRRRLRGLEAAIDLDQGVRLLDPRLKKRIAKLIREGFEPEKVNDRYPEPAALLEVVEALRKDGKVREAAYVSRTIRDIRLLRTLAIRMSGRRERKEVKIRADRRHESLCWNCHKRVQRGEWVFWNRDTGTVWHVDEES